MLRYLVAYVATGLVFTAVDTLWLGWLARSFYREKIGALLLEQLNIPAVIAFYAMYVAAIVVFAIAPNLLSGSWKSALISGALFGLFAYGTYELTNLATLRGWPLAIVVVDMLWGTFLTAIAAAAGFTVTRYLP